MSKNKVEIDKDMIDVLAKTKIIPEQTQKLDDIGDLVKQMGAKGGTIFEKKLKVVNNLTTSVPLNGSEKWEEVLKNARDELRFSSTILRFSPCCLWSISKCLYTALHPIR